jgi:uncharacterized iron-regulated membrane protein
MRNARALCVFIHRWAGLTMASFLVVAALTGSLLAYMEELDALISPQMRVAAPPTPSAPLLDPMALREAVLAHAPGARVVWLPLHLGPHRTARVSVIPATPGGNDEIFVDPYTGRVAGESRWGDISQGWHNLMAFVYRLHFSLALGSAGFTLFGIVALVWTIDCFIGAYLTFPARRRKLPGDAVRTNAKSWWSRWWPAWKVRRAVGSYKLNFDLHRAGGLWLWAMSFVLAWSSVAFNLSEVYAPVTRHLLSQQEAQPQRSHIPALAKPRLHPAIAPGQAREQGRRLIAEQAALRGFTVEREEGLGYDARRGVYTYMVRTSRDIRDSHERYSGNSRLFFDGDSGEFRGLYLPTGETAGDTFTSWITTLHMAAIWGWQLQLIICLMGLVITGLSVTGVVIWWKKRAARTRPRAVRLPLASSRA